MQLTYLNQFDILVKANFKKRRNSQFYADELCISLKRLNNLLGRHRKKTVTNLITERLHAEALQLLLNTDMQIKAIAYELDHCDPGHFSRNFKKISGRTPVEYRKIYKHIKGRESPAFVIISL